MHNIQVTYDHIPIVLKPLIYYTGSPAWHEYSLNEMGFYQVMTSENPR